MLLKGEFSEMNYNTAKCPLFLEEWGVVCRGISVVSVYKHIQIYNKICYTHVHI